MSEFAPASQLLLRHFPQLCEMNPLFSGEIPDLLVTTLTKNSCRVWTTQYHYWQKVVPHLQTDACFAVLPPLSWLTTRHTLFYYWPKNKAEAQFQLNYLLAGLPMDTTCWVVGENHSGVRSIEALLGETVRCQKVDNARRCSLYRIQRHQPLLFDLASWWRSYSIDDLTIYNLPGVFSQEHLDQGTQLLLSTCTTPMQGDILDMGCGAGIIASYLAKRYPNCRLTLCDTQATALACSQQTLHANKLQGEVHASHLYSTLTQRFQMILSNPPFHDGRRQTTEHAEQLVRQAPQFLLKGGELRIVGNRFLPYPHWFTQTFGEYRVLAQNTQFVVYQAINK